jgi:hypothetical protein
MKIAAKLVIIACMFPFITAIGLGLALYAFVKWLPNETLWLWDAL